MPCVLRSGVSPERWPPEPDARCRTDRAPTILFHVIAIGGVSLGRVLCVLRSGVSPERWPPEPGAGCLPVQGTNFCPLCIALSEVAWVGCSVCCGRVGRRRGDFPRARRRVLYPLGVQWSGNGQFGGALSPAPRSEVALGVLRSGGFPRRPPEPGSRVMCRGVQWSVALPKRWRPEPGSGAGGFILKSAGLSRPPEGNGAAK